MWMGGGLVAVPLRRQYVGFPNLDESQGNQDRHRAPSSTLPFPLSLQSIDAGCRSSYYFNLLDIDVYIYITDGDKEYQ